MKISIIIPVYNVDRYLKKGLDSVLDQDLDSSDYEIICINDGSPDTCKTILLDYQQKHSNLVFIDQENQGVSVARNAGLNIAKGKYILFLDGDDSLYPNVLGALYENAYSNNLDLLYLQVDYFDEDDSFKGTFQLDCTEGEILSGFEHSRRGYIFGLYRRELINSIRFEEGIPIAEDALFNIMVHSVAKRVFYNSFPSYKYLIRKGSALNSDLLYSQKTFLGYLKAMDVLVQYINQNQDDFSKEQLEYFNRPLYKFSELVLTTSIIPLLSISRYRTFRKYIKEKKLTYLDFTVNKSVPFYSYHWMIFFSFHLLRSTKNKLKSTSNAN